MTSVVESNVVNQLASENEQIALALLTVSFNFEY